MADRDLGWRPITKNVNLVADTDFVDVIYPPEGETFPVGLAVKIVFNDTDATEFVATVVPEQISWDVDYTVVNTLITAAPRRMKVRYDDGTGDFTWMQGLALIDTGS